MKISTCYQSFFLLAYSAHQSSLSPSCGTLKVNFFSLSPTDLALIELQCRRSSKKSPSELLISSTHSLNTQFFYILYTVQEITLSHFWLHQVMASDEI